MSNLPNRQLNWSRKNWGSLLREASCTKPSEVVNTSLMRVRKISFALSVRDAALFFRNSYRMAASTPPVGLLYPDALPVLLLPKPRPPPPPPPPPPLLALPPGGGTV